MSTDWLAQYKTTSYALFISGSFGLERTVENKALQTRFLKPVTEQNVKSNSNTWRKKMHESLRNAQAKKIWAATAWPSFNSMKHLGVLPLPPGWDASLHRVIKKKTAVGTLRSEGSDNNQNVQKAISLTSKTTTLYVDNTFCRHYTTITWKCLISHFMEDINKWWQIFVHLLNLDIVLGNSTLGEFTYIFWQSSGRNNRDQHWKKCEFTF